MEVSGRRMVAENLSGRINSAYLRALDAELRSNDTPCKLSLLDRLDVICAQPPAKMIEDEAAFNGSILDGMLDGRGTVELRHRVATRLGMLVQKQRLLATPAASPAVGGKSRERRPSLVGVDLLNQGRSPGGQEQRKSAKFEASKPAKQDTSFDRFESTGVVT